MKTSWRSLARKCQFWNKFAGILYWNFQWIEKFYPAYVIISQKRRLVGRVKSQEKVRHNHEKSKVFKVFFLDLRHHPHFLGDYHIQRLIENEWDCSPYEAYSSGIAKQMLAVCRGTPYIAMVTERMFVKTCSR